MCDFHFSAPNKTVVKPMEGPLAELGSGLHVCQDVVAGEVLLSARCDPDILIIPDKDMHSIQISETESWNSLKSDLRFCQHAYDPNCAFHLLTTSVKMTPGQEAKFVRTMILTSREDLKAGSLVTINYNAFEYQPMSTPFTCTFSNRYVNGFAAAEPDEQQFLLESGLAFDHVRNMHEKEGTGNTGASFLSTTKSHASMISSCSTTVSQDTPSLTCKA